MAIVNSLRVPVSFNGNKSGIIISHDNRNIEKLKRVQDELNSVMREIEFNYSSSNFDAKVIKTRERIDQLKRETQEAWGTCPKALKPKMDRLKELDEKVTALQAAFKKVGEDIDNEKPGLILPESTKDGDKKGLITSTLDIMAVYNSLPKDKQGTLNRLQQASKAVQAASITTSELKGSLRELQQDNWSFEKLNADDAKVYKKLGHVLPFGEIKEIVNQQVKEIDAKLVELKENGGKLVPEVGVRVFDPETTGKILALETAKLRRTTLGEQILMPNVVENLDRPDVILLPMEGKAPEVYKIDKSFVPNKTQVAKILNYNREYAPVLKKLYPEGVNVFVIPGYFDHKNGNLEGGMVALENESTSVYLNSYDHADRYKLTAFTENGLSALRELKKPIFSVLKNEEKDRARVLSHELGHAVCYKMMDTQEAEPEDNKSLILTLSGGMDFMKGWKSLRSLAKLNESPVHPSVKRLMQEDDLKTLQDNIDFEMIAEDIRIALTGEKLPAASKMTGFFDQTEEGKKNLDAVIQYLRETLIEDADPSESLMKHMMS